MEVSELNLIYIVFARALQAYLTQDQPAAVKPDEALFNVDEASLEENDPDIS